MLTVTAIQKAKPTEKQYRMVDERGLVLLVRPNGAKLWQLQDKRNADLIVGPLGGCVMLPSRSRSPEVSPWKLAKSAKCIFAGTGR